MNYRRMFQLMLLLFCLQVIPFIQMDAFAAENSVEVSYGLSNGQRKAWPAQWDDLMGNGYGVFNLSDFTASRKSSSLTAPATKTVTSADGNLVLTMTGDIDKKVNAAANKTIHLLSIGNSFSQDAQQWIYNVAKAAGYEDIIIANLYWGGCDLRTHASNAKTDFGGDGQHYEYQMHRTEQEVMTRDKSIKGALQDQNWDYVTLQQVSQDAGMENTFTDGNLDYLIDYVKQYRPNAKIGWHMTWAYQQNSTHGGFANYNRDQMTMYNAIVHCTRDIVMKKNNMNFVFPAGTAIQNLRTSFIGDNLTRDGYHMSYNLGRYVVSLTWIYKLCEMQGNPFPEDITYTPNEAEVPQYYLPAIREAVKNAVQKPYEISQSSYKNIADLLKIDFSKYIQINWEPKAHSYWHSAGDINQTPGTAETFVASKIFNRDDIPTGSILQVDEGYKYRPEAWLTNTSTNTNPRPDVVSVPTVLINDGWWGSYNYRAFNVSKSNDTNISTDEATQHFRVYLPKALGDGGDFKIICKKSGKPLAIKDDSQDNNAGLVQDSRRGSVIWTFEYAGNGYYYIINKNSGKALDVPGGSVKEDTQPIQWDVNKNRNQQWNVIDLGSNLYRISPKCAPTMGLDVAGGRTDDDVNVVQWPYSGAEHELFTLQVAETLNGKIAATPNGGTYKLDQDYADAIQIAQGKDITIDLNGHKLTSAGSYVIRNSGKLRIIDTAGNGAIEIDKKSDSNVEAIVNENSGTLIVEAGSIAGKVSGGGGIAVGIHNKGRIEKISGGDIKAWTYGTAYAYGLWNEGGNVDITDGWFYGAGLADNQSWTNSLAVNNASGTVNISGGVFIGKTRTEGDGYGLRSGGTANLSGGSFVGMNCMGYFRYDNYNDPFDKYDDDKGGMKTLAIRKDGNGSVNYQNNTWHTTNLDGPQVVLTRDQHYVTFVDEAEMPIATYVLDGNGNIVKKWGHVKNSYDVYFGTKTEAVTEADLARYGGNTLLYVNTGDKREVMYFLGSSVTQGTNDHGNSWADYVADRYGDQVITRKRALSGTTLVNTEDASYIGRMLDQISPTAKIDHLIVQLSTNDSGWGLPIGTLGPQNEFRSKYYDNRINDFGKQGSREIINGMEFIIAYAMETWGCKVSFWSGPNCNRDTYTAMEDALTKQIEPKWRDKGMGVIDYYHMWYPEKGKVIADDLVHPYQEGYWQMVPYAYDYFKDFNAKVAAKYINEIGNVTDEGISGEKIEKARFVYDNLMRDAKGNVNNYNTLENAEKRYSELLNGTRKIDNATEVTALAGPGDTGNEGYNRLFDGKIATKSCSGDFNSKAFLWKFKEPMSVKFYYMTTANDNFWWNGRNPKSWKLYGSNDSDDSGNGTWTEVDNVSNDNRLPEENYTAVLYKVDNPARYKYYKLQITDQDARTMQLSEFTMLEDVNAMPIGPATLTPYALNESDGSDWKNQNTLELHVGETFSLGPQSSQNGTWSWVGPDNFTSNDREIKIENATAAKSGKYIVTFTSVNGTQTQLEYTITVIDITGIEQVTANKQADKNTYNLQGQKVSATKKNSVYIRDNKKFVAE